MIKKVSTILFILIFGFGISSGETYKTMTHRFIFQEGEFYKTRPAANYLDDIIKSAEPELIADLNDRAQVIGMLQSIRTLILTKMDQGYNKNISLLGDSFKTGQWRCDKLAFIYLSVAEMMNWPVDIVLAPKHMFIKWRLPDNSYFYWETTNGKAYDDEFYLSKFRISQESIHNGIYMKPLSEKELQAVQYRNIGKKWFEKKQYEKALAYYTNAINLWPTFSEAYNNKAIAEIYLDHIGLALNDLDKAIELDPNCAAAYYNRGRIWLDKGQYKKALMDFNLAKEIDSKNRFISGFINYIEMLLDEKAFTGQPG